ncbi:hypothetical protein D7T58_08415 [Stenotrophomonas maltophilia]|nr:hypothetical protein [Stenotrophomonas maltophilia]MBA0468719.1 hypothetical protein [Stenotrophomonas maltophilia]MBA0475673.1 hypothetical protein [Stenotrophomonas maltophilia]MBA0483828.1 hypothetical protein [Stenotrophomonas maltophilia]QGL90407.1 hypothetical protein FEO91_19665 [Stenotrophomonas maltophilia]
MQIERDPENSSRIPNSCLTRSLSCRARFHPFLLTRVSSSQAANQAPRALLALGERGIELGLDIYEAEEEVRNAQRQQAIN